LSFRSLSLWFLGYPDAALADADHALKVAREIDQAPTLMFALAITNFTRIFYRSCGAARERIDELIALADGKGASQRRAEGIIQKGCVLALIGEARDAVQMITSGAIAWQATGARVWVPLYLSYLAIAYAELKQMDDARRCIGEAMTAMEATKERWYEAEVYRMAGEIELKSPECATKAEAYFQHALAIAHKQQAKSWELRVAMSMARLWRDQGRTKESRKLLAPIYNWFTEGFDTLDLKEARALLALTS
jgi:predicted ATPase